MATPCITSEQVSLLGLSTSTMADQVMAPTPAPATAPEVAASGTFVEIKALSARGLGTVPSLLLLVDELGIPVVTDPSKNQHHRIRLADAVSLFTRQSTWANIPNNVALNFLASLDNGMLGPQFFISTLEAAELLGVPFYQMHRKEIRSRGLPFFQFGKGKRHYLKAQVDALAATNPTFVFKRRKSSMPKQVVAAGTEAAPTGTSVLEEPAVPVAPAPPLPPEVKKLSVNFPIFIPDESSGPDGKISPGSAKESSQLPSPGDDTLGSESA